MTQPVTFRTKLGTAKGAERSRIWIEGERLSSHGFTVGARYSRQWSEDGSLTLSLDPNGALKVSGKGSHPIIDTTGERVRETFGKHGTHVLATYTTGRIIITREVA